MQQKTLFVTQGHLFSVSERGETSDRGACGCALVALPQPPATPKYSLVCYNKKRETLAVARLLEGGNAVSLRLAVERSGYLTFMDETDGRWSLLPSKHESVVELLAQVALAFYVLRGQPTGSPAVTEFTPAVVDRPLGLQHEARVRFASYSVRPPNVAADGSGSALTQLGPLRESNMNEPKHPYAFQPLQSSVVLGPTHRGFEGCVAGMTEDGYRAVVLPSLHQYTRPDDLYPTDAAFGPTVYVVKLERIVELTERRGEVPSVFAEGNSAALVTYQDSRSQLVSVPGGGSGNNTSGGFGGTSATVLAGAADGAGIPVEHMAMVQRLGAGLNTATITARDIRDITAAVSADWEHAVRPVDKPSTLTNAALQDHIQQLILQHERNTADLEQREELIRSLDARNRELQKQVDAATLASQKLMDEAKSSASAGMDARLERSRTLMKLQEQVNATTQERDDAQRHLATVKRLQAATEEELQQLRARIDVHRVQTTGMLNELDVSQTALAEARGRRKGLEARVAALSEAVRSAHAQTRVKASELETTRTASDRARDHHVQLMEDERNSRALDAQQLRTEIVTELANREKAFRAERARAAEEAFRRGLTDGKEAGRRDAAADVAAQLSELQLDQQRSKGQLDSRREELRAAIEAAMASRRRLVTAVKESQAAHAEAVRTKTRLQISQERLVRESNAAKDSALERLRGVTRYITHPASAEQLGSVLAALQHYTASYNEEQQRKGAAVGEEVAGQGATATTTTDIDLTFNRTNWETARKAVIQRRLGYISAEALRVFEQGMRFYYDEWLHPLQAAHEQCKAAVKALWIQDHGAFHYTLCESELAERNRIVEENENFFGALEKMLSRQREARVELLLDAERGLAKLYAEYTQCLGRLRDMVMAQRRAREELSAAETEERQLIASAAIRGLREMPSLFTDAVVSERLTAQRFLAEEEEAGRAALLADELGEVTVLRFNEEQGRAEARHDTMLSRQRQALRDQESYARQELETMEAAELQQHYSQHVTVVSAIFRQSHELKRLQALEQQRRESADAEERRALVVQEEQWRYQEVEAAETRERAELAATEASLRPPPSCPAGAGVPSPLAEEVPQPQSQPQSQPQPQVAPAPPVSSPPVSDSGAGATGPPERDEPPPLPDDAADMPPAAPPLPPPTMWGAPPDMPPPTPPESPASTAPALRADESSPFALAWAQVDNRKQSPQPNRAKKVLTEPTSAAPNAPASSTLPPSKQRPTRTFDDSEEDSTGGSDEGEPAKRPQPPAPAPKKAISSQKRKLFVSSSDED